MAQELEYGDRECDVIEGMEDSLEDYLEQFGNDTDVYEHCESKADTNCDADNGTEYCYWFYNGQGFEYQLLAGPIYIVMFAVSGILLGKPTPRLQNYSYGNSGDDVIVGMFILSQV